MKTNSLKFTIFLVSMAFATVSCKNAGDKTSQIQVEGVQSIEEAEIVYSMPGPDEILNEIFSNPSELKSGIVCDLESGDNLVIDNSIALISGVFIADMAYEILLDEYYFAYNYFRAILKLTGQLEIRHLHDENMIDRIEYNMENKDTLMAIFKESLEEIKFELEYLGKDKTLALIYTGFVIESFYLALENMNEENEDFIMHKVLEQHLVIDNLAAILESFRNDIALEPTIIAVDSVRHYMKKNIKSGPIETRKDSANRLVIGGGSEITTNKENFEILKEKLLGLRHSIVEFE